MRKRPPRPTKVRITEIDEDARLVHLNVTDAESMCAFCTEPHGAGWLAGLPFHLCPRCARAAKRKGLLDDNDGWAHGVLVQYKGDSAWREVVPK